MVKHLRVGKVIGSPKYPESTNDPGQMSIQTLDPSQAKVGEGHDVTHILVEFNP